MHARGKKGTKRNMFTQGGPHDGGGAVVLLITLGDWREQFLHMTPFLDKPGGHRHKPTPLVQTVARQNSLECNLLRAQKQT